MEYTPANKAVSLKTLSLKGDGKMDGLGQLASGSIDYAQDKFNLALELKGVKLPAPFVQADTAIIISAATGSDESKYKGAFSSKLQIDKDAADVDVDVNVEYVAGE
jgi:hypothetical protein